jgi:hypothetical protein
MVNSTIQCVVESPKLPVDAVRHLTQLDLARRWRISTRTLERWRWLGQGPGFLKLGGRVAYRLEEIERYEAAQLRGVCAVPAGQWSSEGATQHAPGPAAAFAASAGSKS